MLSVKILITDDEPETSSFLTSILSRMEGALVVGITENGSDAINVAREHSPDLAFLDIKLPDMQGLELARKLREIKPDMALVFITAYQEYSYDAFKLYAADFILKPIQPERIRTTYQRVYDMLTMAERKYSDEQITRISINMGNERVFLKPADIYYIEKVGRYTLIHCSSGNYKTRQTLAELEQHLGVKFFRSHKSYLINTELIERISTFPRSSYVEVRFNNYKGVALLSRERIHELMKYANYNI